jgi:hypothetical protein
VVLAADTFALIMTGLVGGLLLFLILLGLFYPGSGARQLDWKPTRSAEVEVQNEIDDLDQMLEATNEKRRRRGLGNLTEAQMHARVHEDEALRRELRGDVSVEEEMLQLREAREARRRAREERSE